MFRQVASNGAARYAWRLVPSCKTLGGRALTGSIHSNYLSCNLALDLSHSFSARAEDRRRTERRNRRRQALRSGKAALQSRRIACRRLADYIRRVPTWQDVLEIFKMQKGTFDGYCYAAAFYRISQKPCPQMAIHDQRYAELAQTAVAKMDEAEPISVEEFDASLLCLTIAGVGLTTNPGPTSVYDTTDPLLDDSKPAHVQSISPQKLSSESETLLEKAIELLKTRLSTDRMRQSYWLQPHHLANMLYGLGHSFAGETSYSNSPVSQKMSSLLPLLEQSMERRKDTLGPFEISRTLTGVAMLHLPDSDNLVSLCIQRLNSIQQDMHSIDWALALWSLSTLKRNNGLSASATQLLDKLSDDIGDRIMIQRWNLRPEDLGIISWSLTSLGIGHSNLMAALVNVANHESWRPYIIKKNREALESSLDGLSSKSVLKPVDTHEQESLTTSSSDWAAVGSLTV